MPSEKSKTGKKPQLKLTKAADPVTRSVAARWTPKLAKSFTPVSDYFLENYHRLKFPLTSAEAMLVIQLMSFKWDEEMPYPSFKRLATRMGKSVTAVRKDARSLQGKGCLRRYKQVGTTNRFDLTPLFEQLEVMQKQDDAAKAKAETVGAKSERAKTA